MLLKSGKARRQLFFKVVSRGTRCHIKCDGNHKERLMLGTRMPRCQTKVVILPLPSMLDRNKLVLAVAYSTLVVASPEYERTSNLRKPLST